jgi:hypothetical protein
VGCFWRVQALKKVGCGDERGGILPLGLPLSGPGISGEPCCPSELFSLASSADGIIDLDTEPRPRPQPTRKLKLVLERSPDVLLLLWTGASRGLSKHFFLFSTHCLPPTRPHAHAHTPPTTGMPDAAHPDCSLRHSAQPDPMDAQHAAQAQAQDRAAGLGPYKRASRKGAPRRFACEYPDCDKIYSRAEHLQRHQLNRTIARHFWTPLSRADGLQMPPRRSTAATLPGYDCPSPCDTLKAVPRVPSFQLPTVLLTR